MGRYSEGGGCSGMRVEGHVPNRETERQRENVSEWWKRRREVWKEKKRNGKVWIWVDQALPGVTPTLFAHWNTILEMPVMWVEKMTTHTPKTNCLNILINAFYFQIVFFFFQKYDTIIFEKYLARLGKVILHKIRKWNQKVTRSRDPSWRIKTIINIFSSKFRIVRT